MFKSISWKDATFQTAYWLVDSDFECEIKIRDLRTDACYYFIGVIHEYEKRKLNVGYNWALYAISKLSNDHSIENELRIYDFTIKKSCLNRYYPNLNSYITERDKVLDKLLMLK